MHNMITHERRGAPHYRRMQAKLDKMDKVTRIVRIAPKHYELFLNFELVKKSRNRHTCNKHLVRLYRDAVNATCDKIKIRNIKLKQL